MKKQRIKIDNIPAVIWGEKSDKIFIAVHGNMSYKEDTIIELLAQNIAEKGYQLISFDLPEHGERKENTKYLCKVQNCIKDLEQIMSYVKERYNQINLFACSMGAYFSLLTYQEEKIKKSLFLSPVVNMEIIIGNMMIWSKVTKKQLEEKQEIKIDFGQTLYWDYYKYVLEHPIVKWNKETYILYGSKDTMQEESMIKEFSEQNHCNLTVLEGGEHFFHTKEQLEYYRKWLDEII